MHHPIKDPPPLLFTDERQDTIGSEVMAVVMNAVKAKQRQSENAIVHGQQSHQQHRM